MGLVDRAVKEFNRYRFPETVARVLSFDGKRILVEFTGFFCHTCGVYDYVDDFKLALEDAGVRVVVEEIKEIDNGLVAVFVVE